MGFPGHPMERGYHGIRAREVPAGLVVQPVDPGAFGVELGLAPGDLLVEVGGAPVFGYRELWTVARLPPPGREATATWIRGRELHHGSAAMGPRLTAKVAVA